MHSAIFRFSELPIPNFAMHIPGCGDPETVRELFKRACYRKHIVVKFEPQRFVPLVIREFSRETTVTIGTTDLPRAIWTYVLDHDEKGAPMLRIVQTNRDDQPQLHYHGKFFEYLLHGLKAPPRRKRYDLTTSKLAKESRQAAQRDAARRAAANEPRTPLQERLYRQFHGEAIKRGRIKKGALLRQERLRKIRKLGHKPPDEI